MKKQIIFILLLFTSLSYAQVVTLSVGAIEVDEAVTITVDINNDTDTNCNGLINPL